MKNENNALISPFRAQTLWVQFLVCIGFAVLGWHFQDIYLSCLIAILWCCSAIFAIAFGQKKVLLIGLVATGGIGAYFTYNPYTVSLMQDMQILSLHHDPVNGDVYLVQIKDGVVVGVVNADSKWICHGKRYAKDHYCKYITSFVKQTVLVK